MPDYDVVVLGCGPGGERAAIQAARAGKRVAVVERAQAVGGNRVNWGTIPSKTLRESALFFHQLSALRLHGIRYQLAPEVTVADFTQRQRAVVQRELTLIDQSLERYGVEVVSGHGRFTGPHAVGVAAAAGAAVRTLTADYFVIATGSRPNRPADVPFDGETVFDSETILALPSMPRSMTVLGAGVIGIEYASIFAALGIAVTLVDTRERLLPFLDREVVGVLEQELGKLGVVTLHADRHAAIERTAGEPRRVSCRTVAGRRLDSDVLLYCVGRDGNTEQIGLETLGIVPGRYGLLEVNQSYQTRHPHIYAVGDVIGFPALASTAMEQGRQAMRHAFAIPGPRGRTEVLPFAVYSIPELAYVGATEESLIERRIAYVCGRASYDKNPRGQIAGDTGGMLKLVFEQPSLRLVGAHVVGGGASEIIHVAEAFLRHGATAGDIAELIYNYPTLSDMYRHAALVALGAQRRP